MERFAPVLIPTMNRYAHFKRCVDSLSNCTYADKTELIIGLDFPPSEKYYEGYNKICDYIQTIKSFKKVTVLKREYNWGANKNTINLREYASRDYDRFIFSEDDNEFSPNFLDYINQGLEKFKDNNNIFAICGYNYPIDMFDCKNEYYFSHEFSAWGYGSWFNKFNNVSHEIHKPQYLKKFFQTEPLQILFINNMRLIPFVRQIEKGYLGDVYITTFLYAHKTYTIFPRVSLVRNWGQDGSGIHCNKLKIDNYKKQPIDDRLLFPFEGNYLLEINQIANRKFREHYKMSIKTWLKNFFLFFLVRTHIK